MNSIKLNKNAEADAAQKPQGAKPTSGTRLKPGVENDSAAVMGRPDSIRISHVGARIKALTNAINGLPDVRAERVSELRAQVHTGDYQPPAEEIADRILKDKP